MRALVWGLKQHFSDRLGETDFNVWVLQEEVEAKAAICGQPGHFCICKVGNVMLSLQGRFLVFFLGLERDKSR